MTKKRLVEALRDVHAEMCEGWSDPNHVILATQQEAIYNRLMGKKLWKEIKADIDRWRRLDECD